MGSPWVSRAFSTAALVAHESRPALQRGYWRGRKRWRRVATREAGMGHARGGSGGLSRRYATETRLSSAVPGDESPGYVREPLRGRGEVAGRRSGAPRGRGDRRAAFGSRYAAGEVAGRRSYIAMRLARRLLRACEDMGKRAFACPWRNFPLSGLDARGISLQRECPCNGTNI
jgi:hypothetical protein